jgi:asparagine synthase (glutamine-hydrolysing)
MKYMKAHPEKYGIKPILHTFAIGDVENSTDLPYARRVAEYIGSVHHEIPFKIQDGLNALDTVIWHLETADITTIRASTPHYLLIQKIQSLGIKMVLSGEGSDEVLGGYLYFHYAPSDKEHQLECKRRVCELGYFDCLRGDKSAMGNSVEARVPFLGREFVSLCIDLQKNVKMQNGTEKYILRRAFDILDSRGRCIYLPQDVLYRQKEQFSDGVSGNNGHTWINALKDMTTAIVHEKYASAYEQRAQLYPQNTPETQEAFYYRTVFERMFPHRGNTFKQWIPNTSWLGVASSDPSGRVQQCHRIHSSSVSG